VYGWGQTSLREQNAALIVALEHLTGSLELAEGYGFADELAIARAAIDQARA
jgi:hypothetical protein